MHSRSAPAASARTAASRDPTGGVGRPRHLQGVGDHRAGEAVFVAQQVHQDGVAERRRGVTGQLRDPDVRGHDRRDARGDHGRERRQIPLPQQRRVTSTVGSSGGSRRPWRRDRGSAWRRRPPGALQSGHRGHGVAATSSGRPRTTAGTDDRVVVGAVHVDGGGEVEVDPDGRQFGPDRPVEAPGRSGSSARPRAALPGYGLPTACASRVTSPPSSSIAISTSGRTARSCAVSAASWAGSATL